MASPTDSSSELSSALSEDDFDDIIKMPPKKGIEKYFAKESPAIKQESSPPRPKREPSPPYEPTLKDDPAIAQLVMFRNRFAAEFPKSVPHFGPQELEGFIAETPPAEAVEQFLCALLGFLLNRKQDIKVGHYTRALEDAISNHKGEWPQKWQQRSPLSGGLSFRTMTPEQRLDLLVRLLQWTVASSESIKKNIQAAYKVVRKDNDLNIPLSVQAWGIDGEKRRYYLIEGLNDTQFRIYRESNYTGINRGWRDVAGSIEEARALAARLMEVDGGPKAKEMKRKIESVIPRFEESAEKRKKREYRQAHKRRFMPVELFKSYDTRTRGKRMKYTYSDDEDEEFSDTTTTRRSTRNTGTNTPSEGPTVTLSGRQVKPRHGGAYGESLISGAPSPALSAAFDGASGVEESEESSRPRRAASRGLNGYATKGGKHIAGYNSVDEIDDEDDASEQDYGDDEEDDEHVPLESDGDGAGDLTDEDDMEDDDEPKSLIVKLPTSVPPTHETMPATPATPKIIKLKLSPGKIQRPDQHTVHTRTQAHGQVEAKENVQPAASLEESKPLSEPIKLNGFTEKFTPESPHMSFGKDIESKSTTLSPSIDVSYTGS